MPRATKAAKSAAVATIAPAPTAAPAVEAKPIAGNATDVSYKVADGLYLVRTSIGAAPSVPAAPLPTHHMIIVDCSGSMSYDLRDLRTQLKNKLASLVGVDDLVSLMWFSGPRECDVLLTGERVHGLTDLARINKAIDRLQPVGMTCFLDPIVKAHDVMTSVRAANKGHVHSLLFMSDGQHNSGGTVAQILAACDKAAGGLSAAACVAYGWYAGMPLLQQMAERLGGSAIQAKDFAAWDPIFASIMGRRPAGAAKIAVNVAGDPIGGFVFTMAGGDLFAYAVSNGKAHVAQDATDVWYLSPAQVGRARGLGVDYLTSHVATGGFNSPSELGSATPIINAAYAAVALYAQRIQAKVVKPLLRALGDVALIESYAGAFGKPKTSAFYDVARDTAFGRARRFSAGYDPARVPAPDAFTVLDLLALLHTDDECRVFPDHPEWDYKPIGRGRVDTSDLVTEEELAALTAGKAADVQAALDAIKAQKATPLKFVADPAPNGYPVNGIVPNSETPNISLRVKRIGHVDITERIDKAIAAAVDPAEKAALAALPRTMATFTYRNYAIVADGIVNVSKLPVRLSAKAWAILQRHGAVSGAYEVDRIYVIDVARLPVINESMIETLSAATLVQQAYRYERIGAEQKVYKHYLSALFPPTASKGYAEQYGETAAAWLKEQGFTSNGFSPPSVQAESTDVRTYRSMEVAIAGLSSLPKVDDAKAGKGGKGGALMRPAIETIEWWLKGTGLPTDIAALKSHLANDQTESGNLEEFLRRNADAADVQRRVLLLEMAKAAFVVVVGPAWFKEWGDDMGDVSDAKAQKMKLVAQKTMTLTIGGETVDATIRLRECEAKI